MTTARQRFERLLDSAVILGVVSQAFAVDLLEGGADVIQPVREHGGLLALAQGGLYLIAWVSAYEEFRTFAVERIERLSVTEETFKKTRELPADLFRSSMGVFWGEPEPIELLFAPAVAMVVRGRVWHESQVLDDQADGRGDLVVIDEHDLIDQAGEQGEGHRKRLPGGEPLGLSSSSRIQVVSLS